MLLLSCKDDSIDMGTVYYSPSFLWVEADTIPLKKTFQFDFSDDAKGEGTIFAEFEFVDNSGVPISTDEMIIYIDGKEQSNNRFRVNCNEDSKEISYIFTPSASEGKHQGYLRLVQHNLHRIDNQELSVSQQADLFQWTINYKKNMNPLAKILLCIFLAILVCLLFWFLVIRPSVYPHFGKFRKSVLIKQNDIIVGQLNFAFTGARKVVFYDRKVQQSIWSRIFIGEIKTYVNPLFKAKLTFTPKRRNATAFGMGYSVTPNPIPRSGVTTIINHFEKISITLS